ncbi:MAG: transposon-transfer assisting family protein [Lachnospiraceae bacterium]|nr:transposon-transfer assisting family protein [Lachnospiraceae bacterium]
MTKITFDEEELIVMAMFEAGSREKTAEEIKEILPYIKGDSELEEVVNATVEKMRQISDDEFVQIDLDVYRQESDKDGN